MSEITLSAAELQRDPDRLGTLAALAGIQSASETLSGDDLAQLHSYIVAAASHILSDTQLPIFAAWLQGADGPTIARSVGKSAATVHVTLHGRAATSKGKEQLGAVQKVAASLKANDVFRSKVKQIEAPQPTTLTDQARTWFAGVPPDRFVELAALLVFWSLADAKESLSLNDAYKALPPSVVTHALTRLRYAGFVQTDGVTIKCLRKPPGVTDAD